MDEFEQQAARFGAEMRPDNVEKVDLAERPFKLWAEGEEEPVLARTVVIATGAQAKWLGLESEERLFGKGVSGCATCDAFFFRGKKVAVVGGGDTAMEEAGVLAKFADEVFLIHRRDEFRASKIMLERAEKNEKITFLTDTTVEEILGETTVEGVRIKNAKTGEEKTLPVDGFFAAIGHTPATGLFVGQLEMDGSGYVLQKEHTMTSVPGVFAAIGHTPATGLFVGQLEMDGSGYVLQKEHTMTSVPGVFAAGDVSDTRYRQAITAAADGCRAAIDAERWLEERGEAEHAEDPGVWTAEKDVTESVA